MHEDLAPPAPARRCSDSRTASPGLPRARIAICTELRPGRGRRTPAWRPPACRRGRSPGGTPPRSARRGRRTGASRARRRHRGWRVISSRRVDVARTRRASASSAIPPWFTNTIRPATTTSVIAATGDRHRFGKESRSGGIAASTMKTAPTNRAVSEPTSVSSPRVYTRMAHQTMSAALHARALAEAVIPDRSRQPRWSRNTIANVVPSIRLPNINASNDPRIPLKAVCTMWSKPRRRFAGAWYESRAYLSHHTSQAAVGTRIANHRRTRARVQSEYTPHAAMIPSPATRGCERERERACNDEIAGLVASRECVGTHDRGEQRDVVADRGCEHGRVREPEEIGRDDSSDEWSGLGPQDEEQRDGNRHDRGDTGDAPGRVAVEPEHLVEDAVEAQDNDT